jgi:hypothetical protein
MALEAAVYSSFEREVADKIIQLVMERYKPTQQPLGIIMMFQLIQFDIQAGTDGFTGRKFEACDLKIPMDAVLRFTERLRGQEFARQVEAHLPELN